MASRRPRPLCAPCRRAATGLQFLPRLWTLRHRQGVRLRLRHRQAWHRPRPRQQHAGAVHQRRRIRAWHAEAAVHPHLLRRRSANAADPILALVPAERRDTPMAKPDPKTPQRLALRHPRAGRRRRDGVLRRLSGVGPSLPALQSEHDGRREGSDSVSSPSAMSTASAWVSSAARSPCRRGSSHRSGAPGQAPRPTRTRRG